VKAVILVPTAELAEQIETILKGLCYYCSHHISSFTTTSDKPVFTQVPRLKELPDILISTPGRLLGVSAHCVLADLTGSAYYAEERECLAKCAHASD
jgi:ATP-dependent RNA helicase DDX56/DBP9